MTSSVFLIINIHRAWLCLDHSWKQSFYSRKLPYSDRSITNLINGLSIEEGRKGRKYFFFYFDQWNCDETQKRHGDPYRFNYWCLYWIGMKMVLMTYCKCCYKMKQHHPNKVCCRYFPFALIQKIISVEQPLFYLTVTNNHKSDFVATT